MKRISWPSVSIFEGWISRFGVARVSTVWSCVMSAVGMNHSARGIRMVAPPRMIRRRMDRLPRARPRRRLKGLRDGGTAPAALSRCARYAPLLCATTVYPNTRCACHSLLPGAPAVPRATNSGAFQAPAVAPCGRVALLTPHHGKSHVLERRSPLRVPALRSMLLRRAGHRVFQSPGI